MKDKKGNIDGSNVQSKVRELSQLINDSICCKQGAWDRKDDWHKLWTAIDNLEDTQSAIDEYSLNTNFSRLAIYGLLQAMVVQQDAISFLEDAIKITKPNWKEDYPKLSEIRNIRIETVGHPISRNGSYVSISQSSKPFILEYGVWSDSGFESKSIPLKDIIKIQHDLFVQEIDRVIKKVKTDEAEHKKKHGGTKLVEMLAQTSYFIQKLWSFERSRDYSKINLSFLKSSYGKFKDEIKLRYGMKDVNEFGVQIPGLVMEFQKVDKLLPRIEKMVLRDDGTDEFDYDVYVESLDHSFQSLRDMAKEIDTEFAS